ncbi:cation:proton antiporter [Methanosphaera sp.]
MVSAGFEFSITMGDPIGIILGIIFIICGILVLVASKGLLCNTDDDLKYTVFGRLEILGIVDMIGVLVLILIGQAALGVVYFILAPFATHAIASGHFRGELGEQ